MFLKINPGSGVMNSPHHSLQNSTIFFPKMMNQIQYPELKEPTLTFAEIVSQLSQMTDDELSNLCENTFAYSLMLPVAG